MESSGHLTRDDLFTWFSGCCATSEKIGLEIEVGIVDELTGQARPYAGETGVSAIINYMAEVGWGEPIFDGPYLMGITRHDGAQISLELGGAIEYSSPPMVSLAEVVADAEQQLLHIARVARGHGAVAIAGGNLPFDSAEKANWIPKSRVSIMRDYFHNLGEPGSLADAVMSLTLSTQTTFDYLSEADLGEKLRMQVLASPVIAAMFANSPLEAGRISGALSRRMQYWFKIDPPRCGVLPFALKQDLSFYDIIDWALQFPMIYRVKAGRYVAGPNRSFEVILREGFGDGTWPTLSDWASHLSQVWPHVRVRKGLETRVADGPPPGAIWALPAIWTGLTYHSPSRKAALALLGHHDVGELERTMEDIAAKGLVATLGPDSLHDLARDILELAREGLRARIAEGLEPVTVLSFLDPIEDIIATGRTFAEECQDRWQGDPRTYVARYSIKDT